MRGVPTTVTCLMLKSSGSTRLFIAAILRRTFSASSSRLFSNIQRGDSGMTLQISCCGLYTCIWPNVAMGCDFSFGL